MEWITSLDLASEDGTIPTLKVSVDYNKFPMRWKACHSWKHRGKNIVLVEGKANMRAEGGERKIQFETWIERKNAPITAGFTENIKLLLEILMFRYSITMEIGQHFPIHNVYRFLKHRNILMKYKLRAYISMTSPIQYPNTCTIVHITVNRSSSYNSLSPSSATIAMLADCVGRIEAPTKTQTNELVACDWIG